MADESVPAASRPRALTDEQFVQYCNAMADGKPESEVMAAFGIGRGQYWHVRSAAARSHNRQLWADAQRFQEDSRRHEKYESLYERAMHGKSYTTRTRHGWVQVQRRIGSSRAVGRFFRYSRFDDTRTP